MINAKGSHKTTEVGRQLTADDIKTIAISRVGASPDVAALLEIIDRLTGTEWRVESDS